MSFNIRSACINVTLKAKLYNKSNKLCIFIKGIERIYGELLNCTTKDKEFISKIKIKS